MSVLWKAFFVAALFFIEAMPSAGNNQPPAIYFYLWSASEVTETFDLTFDVAVVDPDDASVNLSLALIKAPEPLQVDLVTAENGHKATFHYHAAAGTSGNSPYYIGVVASDGVNPPVTNILQIVVLPPLRSPPFPATFEANLSPAGSSAFVGRAIFGTAPPVPPDALFRPVSVIVTLDANQPLYTTGRFEGGSTAWAFNIGSVTHQDGATVFTGQTGMQEFQIQDMQSERLQFELSDDSGRLLVGKVTSHPTLRPQLLDTNSVQLSWSSIWDGFTLETSTNGISGSWQPVGQTPFTAGMSNIVNIANTGSVQFFRLKH